MTQHAHTQKSVTIIGAGVIGVMTGRQLQQRGYDVTLIDRDEPAANCSSGNAGIMAAYGVAPLSMPGIVSKVPGMLLDPLGPLTIRRQYFLKILPWLWRFWRASDPQRVERIADALGSLLNNTVGDYQALTRGLEAEALLRPSPILCVYADENAYRQDQAVWSLRERHGVKWHTLKGPEVHDLEPALTSDYQFAAVFERCGYVLNPQRLTQLVFDAFIRDGGHYVQADVQNIAMGSAGPQHIQTSGGNIDAQCVVVACGAWSGQLSRRLGEPVPIEAERGYHVMLHDFEGEAPRHPIMSPSQKVLATPMEHGLRIAGMVEFGGFLPPDFRRSDALHKHLLKLFPKVNKGTVSQWMGHRPTLPDSMPVIGPSARHPSLFYAFGHQHVGLSSAPMTGKVITELISGEPSSVDLTPFRVDRF